MLCASCLNCCRGCFFCFKSCSGCRTRIWLAVLSVLQFAMCMATIFSPIVWILGPFAFMAMSCVFVGMFFKWERGLTIFMWVSAILFVLALIPLMTLANYEGMGQHRPHRMTIFSVELVLNALCLMVGSYAMFCEKGWVTPRSHDEEQGLLFKAKLGKKAILNLRPPKSWI